MKNPWKPFAIAAVGLAAVIFLDTKLRTKGKWAWPEPPTISSSPRENVLSLPEIGGASRKEVPPATGSSPGPATKPLLSGTGRGSSHDHANATTEPYCWALVIFSPKDLDAFPDDVLSCAETCMEAGRCQG